MSKKYGFGVKLAVAALAVAGVVGTVWADLATLQKADGDKASATATVGFIIDNKAEIECTPKNVTEAELATLDWAKISGTPSATNFGTLGTIKVTTNSTAWDVRMTTKYGGRLVYNDGGPIAGQFDCDGTIDPWTGACSGKETPKKSAGTNYPLTYNSAGASASKGLIAGTAGTAATPESFPGAGDGVPAVPAVNDQVQLLVTIGVAKLGSDLGAPAAQSGNLYPLGAPGAYSNFLPIEVTGAQLLTSCEKQLDGTTPTSGFDPISFASLVGNGYEDKATPAPLNYAGIAGRPWTTIASDGFGKPTNGVEYFYVNVGMDSSMPLGGNKKGKYEETFTFDLYASF
jgi:hypothetical protein